MTGPCEREKVVDERGRKFRDFYYDRPTEEGCSYSMIAMIFLCQLISKNLKCA